MRPSGGSGRALVDALAELRGVERVEWLTAPHVPGSSDDGASAGDSTEGAGDGGTERVAVPSSGVADGAEPPVARLRVYVSGDPAGLVGPAVSALSVRGASVLDLSIGEPSLEDVFIHLTGRDLR